MLVKVPVRAMQATSLLPSVMLDVHVPCSHVCHCLVPHLELAVAMSELPSLCKYGMELQLAHYWLHRGTHQLEDPRNLRLLIQFVSLAPAPWPASDGGAQRGDEVPRSRCTPTGSMCTYRPQQQKSTTGENTCCSQQQAPQGGLHQGNEPWFLANS